MKKIFKKRIASILCAAMVIGCIPANNTKAEDVAEPQDEVNLQIQGAVVGSGTNAKIQLTVYTDAFDGYSSEIQEDIRYHWYFGSTKENMESIEKSQETYTLAASDLTDGNGYIQVVASYGGPTDGLNGEYPYGESRILEVKDKSLEVDSIADVTVTGSGVGANNGSIEIDRSNNDLQYFYEDNPTVVMDFQQWKLEGLSENQRVGVKYKEGIVKVTGVLNDLYAVYTIPADGSQAPVVSPSTSADVSAGPGQTDDPDPTVVPVETTKPSEVPGITAEPTKIPDNTAEPTKKPDSTAKPTKDPNSTAEPTKDPGNTAEPTKVPDAAAEPTKAPAATEEPSKVDMTKSGTEVTVGNVVYKSNGSNSVSYDGVKTDKKTVSVPASVTINGKSYPVTKISSGAFSGSKVQKVSLGKNVTSIGANAFKNCKSLTRVTFSAKTTTVGAGSFSGCTKLGTVSLPASVKKIGARAFKNCKKMKKVTLGKSTAKTKSGKVMFGATGGTKVSIGASALENCLSLRSVIINSQVTKIGNNTFKNCKKLASMLVKSLKLKTVGNRALKGVSNCKISVPTIRLKKYRTLFTNKGQGKKVVIAKV